ncbi:ATP-binding protein [Asticcacaulis sp. 201]|uniref:ATP-binding protein n=1 Tax=Asticcacaulis sp. 201 TaxID=3028787 RepID=UPI0029165F64|nr:ATP-binding protein [Asticcacaulis sp. 201]MDV6330716.1 ATP-binding protein [Asticcacaulis sp. 201]
MNRRFPNILRLLLTPKSLSRGLFARMTLVMFLAVLAILGIASTAVRAEVDQIFDQQLVLGANLLVNLMGEELSDIRKAGSSSVMEVDDMPVLSNEDRQAFDAYADWRMFRIWYRGELRLKSDTGPSLAVPKSADASTFHVVKEDGQAWRIYTLAATGGNVMVQVGERLGVRDELVRNIALELAAPFVGIAIVLLVLIWVSLRSGLRDLDGFSARLAEQRGRPPFTSVRSEDWPAELDQLTSVINGLFRRIEDSLQHERTFTEMAAHQLRTPLAALSLEAQLCARIDDPAELKTRLIALTAATTRIAKLADQLLVLARLGAVEDRDVNICMHALIGQLLAEVAPVIAQRRIDVALEGEDFTFEGAETALRLALSNLIENALFYTEAGSEVVIHLAVDAATNSGTIEVRDRGPGMSPADRSQAFNRFWRAPTNKSNGSGLGLAIARDAAQALGGRISLRDRDDGLAGLVAVLILPQRFPN